MANNNRTEAFCYAVLKQSVARCCQSVGWQGIHNGSCDVLTDLLRLYIRAVGHSANAYANLADRSNVDITDVQQTFIDMKIDGKKLLEFVKNVDSTPLSAVPSFPVTRSMKCLYIGNQRKILRKQQFATVDIATPEKPIMTITDEERSEEYCEPVEGGHEISEKIEIWEELPVYLPPQPKIKMNENGDIDDCESGILIDDDRKSTDLIWNSSMKHTSLSHDEDDGSRRSSVSDELVEGGFAQLPTIFRRQSTVTSPSTPVNIAPRPPSVPSALFESPIFDPPSDPATFVDQPVVESPVELGPSSSPISDLKLSPKHSVKSKSNLKLPDDRLELSQTMPQLHLMSPVVSQPVSVCSSPPSLSPLTKSPLPSLVKPVLHKIQVTSSQPIVNPEIDINKTTHSHKEMELKLKHVASSLGHIVLSNKTEVTSDAPLTASHCPSSHNISFPSRLPSISTPSVSSSHSSPSPYFPRQSPGSPPLTPSCSQSVASPLLESSSDIESPYPQPPPPLQSDTVLDHPPSHDLSVSSSTSMSSSADDDSNCKLGSPCAASLPPPPPLLYDPPSAVVGSSNVIDSSVFNTPDILTSSASHHIELFSTSSDSPSSSSISPVPISSTPPKDIKMSNVHVMVPRLETQKHILPLPSSAQINSPLSFQEEEDSSEDSDTSLEYIEYSPTNPKNFLPPPTRLPSKSSSPEEIHGPLTVSIKKITNAPLEFPETVSKSFLTTSTLVKKLKVNADSVFLQQSNIKTPCLESICNSSISNNSSSVKLSPAALIVSIDRDHLTNTRVKKSISPFNTTVTIPKIVLPDIGMDLKLSVAGQSKGKGQKRELELSEVGLNPKRVRRQSPELCSDKFKRSQVQADTRRTRSSQASDDGSESSDGNGLKLKLKIPKPSVPLTETKKKQSKFVKKGNAQSPLIRGSSPVLAYSPPGTLSSKPAIHSEKLFITSSAPKKVSSIKLSKTQATISPPPLLSVPKSSVSLKPLASSMKKGVNIKRGSTMGFTGDQSSPEIYICPICERPDDGTPMICCDSCDIWFHWHCVGVTHAPPANKVWYCSKCNGKKKRKRKK